MACGENKSVLQVVPEDEDIWSNSDAMICIDNTFYRTDGTMIKLSRV